MHHLSALHFLAVPAPLLCPLIQRLLTNSTQPYFEVKKYLIKVLKRAIMNKMMTKIWQSKSQTNKMRISTLCICRDGVENGNPCLLNWYRFLQQKQFFVGSWVRQTNRNEYMHRMLMAALPDTSSERCRTKADYAYDVGDIVEAIRLYAIASCFSK
jgi:hypothetical protein